MSDSGKVGIIAMILWATGTGLVFKGSTLQGFVVLLISFSLGCLAALKGNKWWLILPFVLMMEMFRGLVAGLAF